MAARTTHGDSHSELPLDPDPGPLTLTLILLVAAGGVLGTLARYGLSEWLPSGTGFPRGTLIANLVGTLVLGVLLESLARRGPDAGVLRKARLLVGTGVCGGLTTYSTFAVETDLLIRAHRPGLAVSYAAITVLAGVLVAAFGIAVASRVRGRAS